MQEADPELYAWLQAKDADYDDETLEADLRPFQALMDYGQEFDQQIDLSGSLLRRITNWYEQEQPDEALAVGSMSTGSFVFRGFAYAVEIPIAYGRVNLEPFRCLEGMTAAGLSRLSQDPGLYLLHWADLVDWAMNLPTAELPAAQSAQNPKIAPTEGSLGRQMMLAADKSLDIATFALLKRSYGASVGGSRFAVEMAMKSLLAHAGSKTVDGEERALTEDDLRTEYGHSLKKLYAASQLHLQGEAHLKSHEDAITKRFPPVEDRYSSRRVRLKEAWSRYQVAVAVCGAIARTIHGSSVRRQVEESLNRA